MKSMRLAVEVMKSGFREKDTRFFEDERAMTLYCGLLGFDDRRQILENLSKGMYDKWMSTKGRNTLKSALCFTGDGGNDVIAIGELV